MECKPQAGGQEAPADPRLEAEVDAHDAAVARTGVGIWIGAEPTFTLRLSEAPEWLSEALGGEKHSYALRMVAALRQRRPGSVVLRTVGRQYAGEAVPRWSVGLFERRDGVAAWQGPEDPLAGPVEPPGSGQLDALWEALQRGLVGRGWHCERFAIDRELGRRLLCRVDAAVGPVDDADKRLARPSVHTLKTPRGGLTDPLAAEGLLLIAIGGRELESGSSAACIELPAFARVADFLDCVAVIGETAAEVGLLQVVLQGFPPPVDDSVAWMTVTPDPAVIEVNQAPQPDVRRFLAGMRELFAVAQSLGLSPYRLQYNGTVSDSGGGGQFTLGGRSASDSPFFVEPALLPRLVRYFNQHPCLSYLFAPDYVGSASQSPRADEGTRDAYRELEVALQQLAAQPRPSAESLWSSLAPFLADPSGNVHRSEINIEKLWNPYLPGRGRLGLVEFRAFRMPRSPERAAAIAALLRAIAAMLVDTDPSPGLRDWGDVLHDRFALPFFLRQDLGTVFEHLAVRDLALPECLQSVLLHNPFQSRWETASAGCEFALESAVEFWPLVGDVASQEAGGSRLVDSSTLRLQISLREVEDGGPALRDWQVQVAGYELPLRDERDAQGAVRLIGLRYRDFAPWRGLHPAIRPHGPLVFTLSHPALDDALQLTLHGWRPTGQAYSGLPRDLEDAASRRAERLVTRRIRRAAAARARVPPSGVVAGYTFDLRRLPIRDD